MSARLCEYVRQRVLQNMENVKTVSTPLTVWQSKTINNLPNSYRFTVCQHAAGRQVDLKSDKQQLYRPNQLQLQPGATRRAPKPAAPSRTHRHPEHKLPRARHTVTPRTTTSRPVQDSPSLRGPTPPTPFRTHRSPPAPTDPGRPRGGTGRRRAVRAAPSLLKDREDSCDTPKLL